MNIDMKGDYNVLDLFAGCGGLSQGFEKAGFNIVAANEFWNPAGKTYVRNHPNTRFFGGDITSKETKSKIFEFFKDKRCDVIVGGPPCQAYSLAGHRNPDDPRGKLFEDYVEIVNKLQPRIFVMENVKGILTMKHQKDTLSSEQKSRWDEVRNLEGEKADLMLLRKQHRNNPEKFPFDDVDEARLNELGSMIKSKKKIVGDIYEKVTEKIVKRFRTIGYDVEFKLLNSADYGVPQKRQRVFFIGKRKNGSIKFPEPTHFEKPLGSESPYKTVREAIDDLKDMEGDTSFSHIITSHSEDFLERIRNTPIGKNVFGNYSDAFFRNPPDEPSRTVKENHGGVLVHYEKERVMTPRELVRLQGFPDNFIFEDSKSNILKQIGNAVPVGLANAVASSVRKMIEEMD